MTAEDIAQEAKNKCVDNWFTEDYKSELESKIESYHQSRLRSLLEKVEEHVEEGKKRPLNASDQYRLGAFHAYNKAISYIQSELNGDSDEI